MATTEQTGQAREVRNLKRKVAAAEAREAVMKGDLAEMTSRAADWEMAADLITHSKGLRERTLTNERRLAVGTIRMAALNSAIALEMATSQTPLKPNNQPNSVGREGMEARTRALNARLAEALLVTTQRDKATLFGITEDLATGRIAQEDWDEQWKVLNTCQRTILRNHMRESGSPTTRGFVAREGERLRARTAAEAHGSPPATQE